MSILRAGTGTNYFYAQKHGEPIRNLVDVIGITLSDSYTPSFASNSIDALETLYKVAPEDRPRSADTPAGPATRHSAPLTADSGAPFDVARSQGAALRHTTPTPAPPSSPLTLSLEEMEAALSPTNGWSSEDSRRQLEALHHCQKANPAAPMEEGFDQSTSLGDSSFGKTGWATAIAITSLIGGGLALATAPLWAPVMITVGGGAAAIHLIKSAREDANDGDILRDMSTRLHQKAHGLNEQHFGPQGGYSADFNA